MRVLVTYATLSGSTAQVADAVGEELRVAGVEADVLPVTQAQRPGDYDAVVVGGPMIRGWHKDAVRYLRAHQDDLGHRPVALFFTAMSLTDTGEVAAGGVPYVRDPRLGQAPKRSGRLTFRERYSLPSRYLGRVLSRAPGVRPRAAVFFKGSLDLMALSLWQKLFVLAVVRAAPGDGRNWPFIREWAAGLPARLGDGGD